MAQGVVGEEVRMDVSIIVGLVIGGGVAVIGALIGHFVRLREMDRQWDREKQRMEALWAEEERRRKSDRRLQARKKDLDIVRDVIDAMVSEVERLERFAWLYEEEDVETMKSRLKEFLPMMALGRSAAISMDGGELLPKYVELENAFRNWFTLWLNLRTGAYEQEVVEERKNDFDRITEEIPAVAASVRRRLRELEEEA